MKKICFFISSISSTGGTGRVCTDIANKLDQLGYEITILSFYGSNPFFELNSNIKIVSVFSKKYNFKVFLPYVILKLRSKIIKINPDILISVDAALFLYSFISTLKLGTKNIVWEHFNFNVTLGAKVRVLSRKLAVKYADAIVTLTKVDKANWEKGLNCKVPVFTINNPSPFYNLDIIHDENRKDIVLAVGRLTHQKGFDRLLDIWSVIKMNNFLEWELHIVGSGELKEELEHQIHALGIGTSVKLIPATVDIQKHYKQARIYCMTSIFEGFGMVLIEAQAFGIPVISYDCEAGPAEIINPKNGILVKNGDKDAFVNSLIYLMDNKNVRVAMGEEAYQNSYKYHIDIIIQSWKQLFNIL